MLDLVCTPIPNSMASQIAAISMAEEKIRQSDFYMICGRAEARFLNIKKNIELGRIEFDIEVPNQSKDSGWIDLNKVVLIKGLDEDALISVDCRELYICINRITTDEEERLFECTPDYILLLKGRKSPIVGGLCSNLKLAKFDLLYVGIAKIGDSYDRLFAKGHKARQEILANEPQRNPGARVSDETYLFLFKVEPIFLKEFGQESDLQESDLNYYYDHKRLVADAEKAFINILRPSYNSMHYPNYPKGKDGLYDAGYSAYSYSISEGITLNTKFGEMKGGRERDIPMSNDADYILVKGDEITFCISGVDFDAS